MRSLGELFRTLMEDFSTLVRSEIALAKLELKQAFISLGIGGGLLVGALFCVLGGGVLLVVTFVLVLALFMPAWAATLIVAVLLFVLAGILGMTGRNRLRDAEIVPTSTIESVKMDVDAIKSDLQKLKDKR